MPLPGVPELGDYYADLREMTTVDREAVLLRERAASASEHGRNQIQQHLVLYFLRNDQIRSVAGG